MALLFFNIGRHVGGHTGLSPNIAAKTTLCLYIVKRLIVTLRRADVTTSSSQHFS